MGGNTFKIKDNGKFVKEVSVDSYDFIPIITIDLEKLKKDKNDNIWTGKGFKVYKHESETLELSPSLDNPSQELFIIDFEKYIEKIEVDFKISKGNSKANDPDGYIRVITENINSKYYKMSKKYGDKISLPISSKFLNKDTEKVCYLTFKADDNGEDIFDDDIHGKQNILCGKIQVKPYQCFCKRDIKENELKEMVKQLRLSDPIGEVGVRQSIYSLNEYLKNKSRLVKNKGYKIHEHYLSKSDETQKITYIWQKNGELYVLKGKTPFTLKDNLEKKEVKIKTIPGNFFTLKETLFETSKTNIFTYNRNEKLNSPDANFKKFAEELNKAFGGESKINTCKRKLYFLAQCYVESFKFQSTYEGKDTDTKPKGGKDFVGRGLLQLTHDYNYIKFYAYLNNGKIPSNTELLKFVPKLSQELHYAIHASTYFWGNIGSKKGNINQFADIDDLLTISKEVNGYKENGELPNSYESRERYTKVLKKFFDCKKS